MPSGDPIHLKPQTALAERVLLPGDPHRALAVAQHLLDSPRMFNHHRGLWGYTGTAPDGEPLTVQSTGMGGPSAAIVVHELIDLGARAFVRIGTCGALDASLALGELVAARRVLAADGTSRALGAGEEVEPDPGLTDTLAAASAHAGTVVSTDVFYDEREGVSEGWAARGALAVEMEAATVLHVSRARGARAACVLVVSDVLASGRTRIAAEDLEAASLGLGEAGYAALAATR